VTDSPLQGSIIRYPYLWAWQHERGETEGRKERPVCLALSVRKATETRLYLLPISGTRPEGDQIALEIPPLERRRAGLDTAKPAWITVSEFNRDVLEKSFYFDSSTPPLGRFSGRFLKVILQAFRESASGRRSEIDRT